MNFTQKCVIFFLRLWRKASKNCALQVFFFTTTNKHTCNKLWDTKTCRCYLFNSYSGWVLFIVTILWTWVLLCLPNSAEQRKKEIRAISWFSHVGRSSTIATMDKRRRGKKTRKKERVKEIIGEKRDLVRYELIPAN